MTEESEKNENVASIVEALAALAAGDPWLSADGCAAFLGGIKRRTFLETIACLPTFPIPLPIGGRKAWKKSEIDAWAKNYRLSPALRPVRLQSRYNKSKGF